MRQRHGVLGGLADGVGEVEAVQPLVEGAAERVQEHHRAQLLGAAQNGSSRGSESSTVLRPDRRGGGERGDLDAEQPALEHGVVEGFHDEGGVLQRHQAEAVEPVRGAVDELADRLVGGSCQLQGQLFGGQVVEVRRRRRDQLHVHALRVHVREPAVQVGELRPALLDHLPETARLRGRCAAPRAPAGRRSPRARLRPPAAAGPAAGCARGRHGGQGLAVSGWVLMRVPSAWWTRSASGRARRRRGRRRAATGRAGRRPRPPPSPGPGAGR